MKQIPPGPPAVSVAPVRPSVGAVRALAGALAAASWLLALLTLLSPGLLPGRSDWPMALLVLAATLSTVMAQTRRLPLQNVLLAAAVVALMGGAVHALGAATAMPFGPFNYTERAGPRIFNTLAWPIPFVWVVAVLNSRGVARLMLRPWRKLRSYGFWLIGLTVGLTVLFDLGLEPFAASVKRYWLWQPTRLPLTWGGAPVTNFLGWLVTALLILAFATPALIDKRQQRSTNRPPDYHSLAVWVAAMALFAVGAATSRLWPATIYCLAAGVGVAVFAVRGARW
jgi:uncharacterized membrane protein